jgi:hypothetical protein
MSGAVSIPALGGERVAAAGVTPVGKAPPAGGVDAVNA